MRLCLQVWLLASLLASLTAATGSTAPTANLDIWLLDKSCANYFDGTVDINTGRKGGSDETAYLQRLFNRVLAVATAAQSSLQFVLQKRPDRSKELDNYLKWIRIADMVAALFGIVAAPEETRKATDEHWKDLFYVYDTIVQTLPSSQNKPPNGHNPANQATKPLFMCGDNWDWYSKRDYYPGTKTFQKNKIRLKNIPNMKEDWDDGAVGAWWANHRFVFQKKKEKPVVCTDDFTGYTDYDMDMMTLCDSQFTTKWKSAWMDPAKVKINTRLDDLLEVAEGTLLHELTHWFGVRSGPRWKSVIVDKQAVDASGDLIWWDDETQSAVNVETKNGKKLPPITAAAVRDLFALARSFDEKHNSGPAVAVENAESLVAFAFAMYHPKWTWKQGKAEINK